MGERDSLGRFTSKEISLAGVKQLKKRLDGLGKAGVRIAGSGLGRALTVLLKSMKREAPRGKKGNLDKALGKRFKRTAKKGVVQAKAGANVGIGKGEQKKLGNHVHLVIEGTGEREQKTTGRYTGAVRKINGFVKRATRKAEGRAAGAMVKGIKAGIEKELRKR